MDLVKVTSLKVEDDLFSSLFWGVKSDGVTSLCLFLLDCLIFFLLLSKYLSRALEVLLVYFKRCSGFWQYGKVTNSFLQALTCLVKPLVDLTTFPHLRQTYNLNSFTKVSDLWMGQDELLDYCFGTIQASSIDAILHEGIQGIKSKTSSRSVS